MHVIEVIPLSVLPPNVPQVLSYYNEFALQKGAAVEVLVNNHKVQAIVIGSNLIESQKIILKKSAFELKKISKVISDVPQVSEYQFKIALWLANTYAAPLGLCLKSVLPSFFLKKKYPVAVPAQVEIPNRPAPGKPEWILSRAKSSFEEIGDRVAEAAKYGQVLIMVPEMSYIAYFKKFPSTAAIINSQISNQEWYDAWTRASGNTVRIVIGTRQALSLPFADLRLLITIDPLHEFYKSDLSPKYRAPDLARMVAELHNAQQLTVSNILGVTGYAAAENQQLNFTDHVAPWRADIGIVDMIAEIKQGYFGLFAPGIKERMSATVRKNQKILILSARRGYTGILLCEHCSFSFKCPNCNVPMRIHQSAELLLLCHRCGVSRPYPHFCPNCHSSKIKPNGPAGSQKIFEALQKMLEYGQLSPPSRAGLPILILDSDVTQNQTEEDEVMETIREKSPAILIATQKVFSYIYDLNFDYIIIPQFDALMGGTDFQASEYLWYQLEKLADFEPERIDVQTFHNKETVPAVALHEYKKLYAEEIQLRSVFKYPPFSRLVKLTFSHVSGQKAATESRILVEKLKMAAVHLQAKERIIVSESSPAFISKEKGRYTATILMKVIPNHDPVPSLDKNLLRSVLRYVPSHWLIDVDPRSTT